MAPPAAGGRCPRAPRSTRLRARGPGRGGRRGGAGPAGAARAGRDGDRSPPRSPGTGLLILWRRAARRHCPLGQVPTEGSSRRSGSVGRRAPGGRARHVVPVARRRSARSPPPRCRMAEAVAIAGHYRDPGRHRVEGSRRSCCRGGTRSTSLGSRRPRRGHLQGRSNEVRRPYSCPRRTLGTESGRRSLLSPPPLGGRGSVSEVRRRKGPTGGLCRQVRHERWSTTSRLLGSDHGA